MLSPDISFAELPHPARHSSAVTPIHTECLVRVALTLFPVITVSTVSDDKTNRRPEARALRPSTRAIPIQIPLGFPWQVC
ncbi:MAG: hypothetical protein NTNFB01_00310 [Nitrospira sp.]